VPAARAAIARADCRTGRVTRVRAGRSSRGRVIRQVPKPGSRPAFPSHVRLVVGR
jgi:beta-lactam-binding protein with PASTA domain